MRVWRPLQGTEALLGLKKAVAAQLPLLVLVAEALRAPLPPSEEELSEGLLKVALELLHELRALITGLTSEQILALAAQEALKGDFSTLFQSKRLSGDAILRSKTWKKIIVTDEKRS